MRGTGLTLKTVRETLERLIPPAWAASGEVTGLQIGDPNQSVIRVRPVVSVTHKVLQKALRLDTDLLIAYRAISNKLEAGSAETRLLQSLLRTDIAVYATGSSIDPHPHGPSHVLAKWLGLKDIRPALPRRQADLAKIVTFVPRTHTDVVRSALADAGAGRIGEYDLCSYRLEGEGSFRGSERTSPFVGVAGRLEFEEEDRLEMVLPLASVPAAVKSLWKAHPYEEPAYDVFRLHDLHDPTQTLWIGEMESPVSWADFGDKVSKIFHHGFLYEGAHPGRNKRFRSIACTATDASSLIPWCLDEKADALVCLGLDSHAAWLAVEYKLPCIMLSRHVLDGLFLQSIQTILQTCEELKIG